MQFIINRTHFIRSLRDALSYLYDPYELKRNSLQTILGNPSSGSAIDLKQILINAINRLMPDEQTPFDTKAWKVYELLSYRFIDQLGQKETAKTLLISLRTLQRLSPEAIEILAEKLASDFGLILSAEESEPTLKEEQDHDLAGSDETWAKEMTFLKTKNLEDFIDNRQMLKEITEILQPIRKEDQNKVQIELPEETWLIRGQVTFLRQAVLTAVSSFDRSQHSLQIVISSKRVGSQGFLSIQGRSPEAEFTKIAHSMDPDVLKALTNLMQILNGDVTVTHTSPNEMTILLSLPIQQKYTILIVDDNADAIHLVEKYLSQSIYILSGVQEPEQVAEKIEQLQPALILLDVMLPNIDGWMLLSHIRRNPSSSKIPVIVSTILPQEGLSISLGADGFLRKPFTQQELIAILDTHILKSPGSPRAPIGIG